MRSRRSRARRHERGASLVEFALVAPVLFMVLFGILDFGVLFASLNSMRQGTREGTREAVVASFGTSGSCSLAGVADTTTDGAKLACLTKDRIGLPNANVRVRIRFATTNNVGQRLIVCSMYPMTSVTGMFTPLMSGNVIKSKVEMRIEQIDTDLVDTAETVLAGQNWTWCA